MYVFEDDKYGEISEKRIIKFFQIEDGCQLWSKNRFLCEID